MFDGFFHGLYIISYLLFLLQSYQVMRPLFEWRDCMSTNSILYWFRYFLASLPMRIIAFVAFFLGLIVCTMHCVYFSIIPLILLTSIVFTVVSENLCIWIYLGLLKSEIACFGSFGYMLWCNILRLLPIQILKHDWPARWRSFIPDLVSAAKTSETICENCMAILKVSLFNFRLFQR